MIVALAFLCIAVMQAGATPCMEECGPGPTYPKPPPKEELYRVQTADWCLFDPTCDPRPLETYSFGPSSWEELFADMYQINRAYLTSEHRLMAKLDGSRVVVMIPEHDLEE